MTPAPRFSVVMATRDRPALFAAALDSVLRQTGADFEVVVVNDGSAPEHAAAYAQVLAGAQAQADARPGRRLRSMALVRRQRGHGSSYSMNHGAEQARGEYVCFLDDDDLWTDTGHLQRADRAMRQAAGASGLPVDLYMTNQEAVVGGQRLPGAAWLEALAGHLQAQGRVPDGEGAWRVSVEDLLLADGFCHVNCLTVRRDFFLAVGGFDESIRWENDRECYLRLIDIAQHMLHHPALTARHHVPDPKAGTSITTGIGQLERRLWQLRVMDKCMVLLKQPALRAHARLHKGYVLKRIAQQFEDQGDWRTASQYAAEALAVLPTAKWAAYTLACYARRLLPRRAP